VACSVAGTLQGANYPGTGLILCICSGRAVLSDRLLQKLAWLGATAYLQPR